MIIRAIAVGLLALWTGNAQAQTTPTCGDFYRLLSSGQRTSIINYIVQTWIRLDEDRVSRGCDPIRADDSNHGGSYDSTLNYVNMMCDGNADTPLYYSVAQTYQMYRSVAAKMSGAGYGDPRAAMCR
jgi:hypothetical protein